MPHNLDLFTRLEELHKKPNATPEELDDVVRKSHDVYDEHVLEQRQAAAKRITQAIEALGQGYTVRPATKEETEDRIDLVIHSYGREDGIPVRLFTSYDALNARQDPGGLIIHVNAGQDEPDDAQISRYLEVQIKLR